MAVRKGIASGADEVAAAKLGRVEAQVARRGVDGALDRVGRLRPAGTAIGIDRDRVGVGAAHLDVDGLEGIDAVIHLGTGVGRDERPELGQVGAQVGDQRGPQRPHPAVPVDRDLHAGDVVAAMRVRDEALSTIRHPLYWPAG